MSTPYQMPSILGAMTLIVLAFATLVAFTVCWQMIKGDSALEARAGAMIAFHLLAAAAICGALWFAVDVVHPMWMK